MLDHPNERSLHMIPTPRSGGMAIFLASLFSGIIVWAKSPSNTTEISWLAVAAVMVVAVSYFDDRRDMPVVGRLSIHIFAAALLVAGGMVIDIFVLPGIAWHWPRWLAILTSMLFLVWMVNLYNFMDGMDGLAAGMAVIGFSTFALLGWIAGETDFMQINLVVAASAAGFLLFNFPPARIFMGDTGSAYLGLLAGGLTLWGAQEKVFSLWVGLLVFSPFIVDASVTLAFRLARGEKAWAAHRTHYYQRLVQSGAGHRKTVLYEYALMLACGFSALLAGHLSVVGQWGMLGGWGLVYVTLIIIVSRRKKEALHQ